MAANENYDSESDEEKAKFEKITNIDYKIKTSLEEPLTDLELKPLPDNLEYVFLEEPYFLHVIISSQLFAQNKSKLVSVLKKYKETFAWKTTDIDDICPSFCNTIYNFWMTKSQFSKNREEIKDKKGTENVAADHLSRIDNNETSDDSEVDDNFPGETLMEINTRDEPVGNKMLQAIPTATEEFALLVKIILSQRCINVSQICINVSQIVIKLETLKEEKERVDGKLAGLLKASKDLNNLIESQRPSPTVKSTSRDDQNRNYSASENGESTDSILSKPTVKFVKAAERVQRLERELKARTPIHKVDRGRSRPVMAWVPKKGIDFMGPFPKSHKFEYILVAVEYVSKWAKAQALPTNDARVVITFLKKLFCHFRMTKDLISDRGAHFCNKIMENTMKRYGVSHHFSTSYHPQTSGQVENTNRALKRILENSVKENPAIWSRKLNDALWAFHTA
nr:reverse transcriptase domain-containing protein [Tanacetum cinerariifolium]